MNEAEQIIKLDRTIKTLIDILRTSVTDDNLTGHKHMTFCKEDMEKLREVRTELNLYE